MARQPHSRSEQWILRFGRLVGRAKRIARKGWTEKPRIPNPESVAEHVFRTSLIAMAVSDHRRLDTEKVLRMVLLHDLPEVVVGDLTPRDRARIGTRSSKMLEDLAMKKVLETLPESLAKDYRRLWKELRTGKSLESKLVLELDRMEMALQAKEYALAGFRKSSLRQFWLTARRDITDSELRRILIDLEIQSR